MSRARKPVNSIGNISARKLPDGRWQAHCWVYDQVRHRFQVRRIRDSEQDARAAVKREAADRLAGTDTRIKPDHTLAQAIALWDRSLDTRTDELTESTIKGYRREGARLARMFGDLLLAECDVATSDDLIARLKTHAGIAAARHGKRTLSLVFGLACRHGALAVNPMRDTSRIADPAKIESALDAPQFQAILNWVNSWREDQRGGEKPDRRLLADIITLIAGTSARPGEVLAFRRRDVRVDTAPDGTRAYWLAISGKIVNKDGFGAVRDPFPKRARQSRVVQAPSFCAGIIDRLLDGADPSADALLLPISTGRPRSVSNVERLMRKFRADHEAQIASLGIPLSEFTYKLFRRTAATAVDAAGGADLASDLLGHANTATTRRHYAVRLPNVPASTAAILEAHLFPDDATEPEPEAPQSAVVPEQGPLAEVIQLFGRSAR